MGAKAAPYYTFVALPFLIPTNTVITSKHRDSMLSDISLVRALLNPIEVNSNSM